MVNYQESEPNEPIRLVGEKGECAFGICIRFSPEEIGVQVPGEENIRWVPVSEIEPIGGGALSIKRKARSYPPMEQRLVASIEPDGSVNFVDFTRWGE